MLINSKTASQSNGKSLAQFPFLCLCAFALFRPILSIEIFSEYGILGLNFLELFSIGISYLFIIAFLFNLFRFRFFSVDFVSVVGLLFCLHLLLTIVLGSYIRETSRLFLPFAVFLCVRTTITEKKQIITLLSLTILSYIIPLFGSAWLIMLGQSVGKTIYQTGLDRYEGLYLKIHAFSHSMFIFLFSFLLYLTLNKEELKGRRLFILFLYFLSLLAIFNLFKSYTRNVWIGLFILLTFFLAGRKNYIILAGLLICVIVVAMTSSSFHTIFFDIIEPISGERNLNAMGAGRLGMWTHILQKFSDLPIGNKLVGIGIGIRGSGFEIARGHNDFLSLLYTTGIIGLFLYLIILFRIGYDMIRSCMDKQLKYLFLGFLCAVIFMNLASNSYLSRIELGQYFWLIVGFFYVLNDHSSEGTIS
jgi:O-antigen ligase